MGLEKHVDKFEVLQYWSVKPYQHMPYGWFRKGGHGENVHVSWEIKV